ncbi:hypothetical protein RN001_010837 [Aquatica leii]|uniref:Uncharacterized protein n=1 Tax=Aquatica leii TaxID=1421715 RepID=A0AAN7PAH1_9COLE|nr:hypothetical protein RN001_010837 [Aquatica leii]
MLNYTLIAIILSIFLFKFSPANKTATNSTSIRSNSSYTNNTNNTKNISKLLTDDLNLTLEFKLSYIKNFTRVKYECLNETMAMMNYSRSQADTIDMIERSWYVRRNNKETRCWCGCVCRRMMILNASNVVVDDELEIFSRVLVNDSHIEDEIDEDCADLENTIRGLDYCDMGFKLYICILDQFYDYD